MKSFYRKKGGSNEPSNPWNVCKGLDDRPEVKELWERICQIDYEYLKSVIIKKQSKTSPTYENKNTTTTQSTQCKFLEESNSALLSSEPISKLKKEQDLQGLKDLATEIWTDAKTDTKHILSRFFSLIPVYFNMIFFPETSSSENSIEKKLLQKLRWTDFSNFIKQSPTSSPISPKKKKRKNHIHRNRRSNL